MLFGLVCFGIGILVGAFLVFMGAAALGSPGGSIDE